MEEIPELTFRLMLNRGIDHTELCRWFREEWSDLNIEWNEICTGGVTPDNWLSIGYEYDDWPNPESKCYYIEVATRQNESIDSAVFERQVEFARLLLTRLKTKGCTVKFQGFFEEYL